MMEDGFQAEPPAALRRSHAMALGQVDSGAEMAAFAGQAQRANSLVAFNRGQRLFEFGEHQVIDGVALLGPGQPDRGVIIVAVDLDHLHKRFLPWGEKWFRFPTPVSERESAQVQRGSPKMRSATRLRWMSWVPP